MISCMKSHWKSSLVTPSNLSNMWVLLFTNLYHFVTKKREFYILRCGIPASAGIPQQMQLLVVDFIKKSIFKEKQLLYHCKCLELHIRFKYLTTNNYLFFFYFVKLETETILVFCFNECYCMFHVWQNKTRVGQEVHVFTEVARY